MFSQVTEPTPLTHRETLRIMFGLLSAVGTVMLGATVVATALPTIAADVGGTPTQLTLIFLASMATMTISTPIWGKLSDQLDKKRMMQISLLVFVVGSMLCGIAASTPMLIGFRLIQGVGMGGVMALTQTILASVIPPRIRGRYNGYYGAVTATATVSGPLIGGTIVDVPGMGWRWVFFLCVPFALASLVLLQRFLKIDHLPKKVRFDYLGAALITVIIALLLTLFTFAGDLFAWRSWTTVALAGPALALVGVIAITERRVSNPLIPIDIVRQRTVTLAILASIVVGMCVFGAALFLAQYFQNARGVSPAISGLLVAPMMVGSLIGSVGSGQLINRYGKWKRFLLLGALFLIAGLSLAGSMMLNITAPLWTVAIAELMIGLGMGMLVQNLILATQNNVDLPEVGTASAAVAFMRSLGGTIGVAILGALMASQLDSLVAGGTPQQEAYARAIGHVFLTAAAVALLALAAVLAIREVPLRATIAKAPNPDSVGVDAPQ